MSFWKRLIPGKRTGPELIKLDADELSYQGQMGLRARIWSFADGDRVALHFREGQPDLPQAADVEEFLAQYQSRIAHDGAKLVECATVELAQFRGLEAIVKDPQDPTGMVYWGELTLPFESFSFVIRIQCRERGNSGLREVLLLDEALDGDEFEVDPQSEQPAPDWNPDSSRFDGRFPDHPVARVRTRLASVRAWLSFDERLQAQRQFQLPSIDRREYS
jgi:hypothetical protein